MGDFAVALSSHTYHPLIAQQTDIRKLRKMTNSITASALARRLGDILGRVRYRGETFLVERHNTAIARLGPVPNATPVSLRDAAAAWMSVATDAEFAADLARIGDADTPPANPWD